tara:strand:- start:87 stop:476 length:390 start_codon:yes stop_codon:yes gene_type:complete
MSYNYTQGFLPHALACALAGPTSSDYPECINFKKDIYNNTYPRSNVNQLGQLCDGVYMTETCQRKIIKELKTNRHDLNLFCSFKNIWEKRRVAAEVTEACKKNNCSTVINNTYNVHPGATFEKNQHQHH